MLLVFALCYYPFFSAFGHSLTAWNGLGAYWIGLDNFTELFKDSLFLGSLGTVAIVAIVNIIKTVTMPFLAAELVFTLKNSRTAYLFRFFFVIALVIPQVTYILLWKYIYSFTDGPLNMALTSLGLGFLKQDWLGDPRIALGAVLAVGFPFVEAFAFLIYLAALQGIPSSIYDASSMDGANAFHRIMRIEVPILIPQFIVLVNLSFIGSLQGFYNIMILTDGGPGFSTLVPGLYMYKSGFEYVRFGYASAIAVILFLLIAVLSVINLRLTRNAAVVE